MPTIKSIWINYLTTYLYGFDVNKMKLGDIEINNPNVTSGFHGKQVIIPIEEYEHLQAEIKHLYSLTKDKPCIRVATEYDKYYTLYGEDEYKEIVKGLQLKLEQRIEELLSLFPVKEKEFENVEKKFARKPSSGLSHLIWNKWYDKFRKK